MYGLSDKSSRAEISHLFARALAPRAFYARARSRVRGEKARPKIPASLTEPGRAKRTRAHERLPTSAFARRVSRARVSQCAVHSAHPGVKKEKEEKKRHLCNKTKAVVAEEKGNLLKGEYWVILVIPSPPPDRDP